MASDDAREPAPRRWVHLGIWLLVCAGVFWCLWASWQEGTPSDRIVGPRREPEFVFVTTPDPVMMHWLPAVAALGALIAGIISGVAGRANLRYLVFAGTVSGMRAVTVGIEWLLGQ